MHEAANPFLDQIDGPTVIFELIPEENGPEELILRRQPELLYGLRNFIENAVEFGKSKVLLTAHWDQETLEISIHDDGPGFSQEVLARLGEPYVTTRGPSRRKRGMGLGFFISKTLLERTGAEITFDNQTWRDSSGVSGAWVSVKWPINSVQSVAA